MINDERWQSRISTEKSGSFNNDRNVHFLEVFIFLQKNYKFSGKSDSIFWKLGPFLNSLRKPHVRQESGSGNNEPGATPIDAIFAFFGHIEWTIAEKLPVWWKWCFGYRKRYLRTTYPEKMSHRALAVHEICPPRFSENFEWSKKKFSKKNFFRLRIVQFV